MCVMYRCDAIAARHVPCGKEKRCWQAQTSKSTRCIALVHLQTGCYKLNFILHKVGSRAILPLRQNNAAIGPQQMCLAVCGKVQQ